MNTAAMSAVTFAATVTCAAVMVMAAIALYLGKITYRLTLGVYAGATGIAMLLSIRFFPHPSIWVWMGAFGTSVVAWIIDWHIERRYPDAYKDEDLDDQD